MLGVVTVSHSWVEQETVFFFFASTAFFLQIDFDVNKTLETCLGESGLSLSISCQQNALAEKDVIASWILTGNHSVKNNKWFLSYACTII